jgi:CBS domain-containing protein
MKDIQVRDFMVPLAEYATVSQDATLCDAIIALRKAQADFEQSRYRHRAVLVFDQNDRVVGKLSQMDIIKALEPDFARQVSQAHLSRFGISKGYIESLMRTQGLWSMPVPDLCSKSALSKVKDIMYTPTKGEYIEGSASLQQAVHRLIIGHHHSLLVTEGEEIVGVLRLTDVFALISEEMIRTFAGQKGPPL